MGQAKNKQEKRKRQITFLASLWPRCYKGAAGFLLTLALFWLWPFLQARECFTLNEWPWEP
jgi:hypothetical protein